MFAAQSLEVLQATPHEQPSDEQSNGLASQTSGQSHPHDAAQFARHASHETGACVGDADFGDAEGRVVGDAEGNAVGRVVGDAEGNAEGRAVGDAEGSAVGAAVVVGDTVGSTGRMDGNAVGVSEHAPMRGFTVSSADVAHRRSSMKFCA